MLQVGDVMKHHMEQSAKDLVLSASGRPVLCSYSSDGTPMKTAIRVVSDGDIHKSSVVRHGRDCTEFLLQRSWYKTLNFKGEAVLSVLIKDPLPLSDGKGADNCYTAAVRFAPLLKDMSHRGVSINHYSFDRALFTSMRRKLSQRHALLHARLRHAPVMIGEALPMSGWIGFSSQAVPSTTLRMG